MLKHLRRKFIGVFMAVAAVMLLVIFGVVTGTTYSGLERQSMDALQAAAAVPGMAGEPEKPGSPERPGVPGQHTRPGLRPYFALERMPDGTLLAAGSEQFDLSDEDYLRLLLEQAEGTEEQTGILYRHGLRFLRAGSAYGVKYVFVDISSHWTTLRELTVTCLLIGIPALALFFLAALLLARWMVRPVEEAWDRQRQFVADASHELKTPLTVIMTNADMLCPDLSEESRIRAVAGIRAMSGQMRGLVEGLLELARVDSGAVEKQVGAVDLSRLTAETALPFDALFFEQGLTLSVEAEEGISVKGSESHLRQVAEILLDNAQKYSTPGTEVRVELKRHGRGQCLLSVSGMGAEISKEDLTNIFKRFYRLDKARSMNHSYGLGLSIAESIVHDHRGRIWAESAGGINTFFVQLPADNK